LIITLQLQDVVLKLSTSRSHSLHDIESFNSTYSTDAEDEGIIEDGIQLYEELIGVKKSILDK